MKLYKCHGISMEGLIKPKDIIIVEKIRNYHLFDILVFKNHGILFCHRCVWLGKKRILEYGENAKLPSFVSKEDIIGKAIGVIRDGKTYKFGKFSLKYLFYIYAIIIYKFIWFKIIHINNNNHKTYIHMLQKIQKKINNCQMAYINYLPPYKNQEDYN